ncbi:arsenate reductase [Candidatus Kirkpatrickella diaphorinae]|uniref:Arsenate reductase n=1 Tax=Candidatus Kirkpatrickella diaphorinae TaxID=2984322 RepID=A0ABY6GLX2_9PROT|nr:arsenate reductase [Candidatus Kirkpatrickella diaphorinae]UYH52086.1 arsenate reductase [Candidatus Kirkpatrickella diaphorinae]
MSEHPPTLYGIPNCGSVKKARAWLEARGVDYRFVDFKKTPPTETQLTVWEAKCGWEVLLNRRGTTFRGLAEGEKAELDAARAKALMLKYPSIIKRPVLEHGTGDVTVGFDAATYEALFPA